MGWTGRRNSGMNPGAAHTPPSIHQPGHEVTAERNMAEILRYAGLLGQLRGNENWRNSRIARLGRFVGRAGRLSAGLAQTAWGAGAGLLEGIIPPELTRNGGVLREFVSDLSGLTQRVVVQPARGLYAQRENFRQLFGNLGAGGLTEGEVMSLNRAIADHQNAMVTNGGGCLADIERRHQTCRAVRDNIQGLIDRYRDQYASSHLLQGLYEIVDHEFTDLDTALGHSRTRQTVVEAHNNQNTSIDSSIDSLRAFFASHSSATSTTDKNTIRAQQHAFFASTYEPQVTTLRTAFQNNVNNLLQRMDRQLASPGANPAAIQLAYVTEISRLKTQARNRTMYESGWTETNTSLIENQEDWVSPGGIPLNIPNVPVSTLRILIP